MTGARKIIEIAAWLAIAAAWAVACVASFKAPEEATMGIIQKIFYLHLPSAICTFLACLLCFVASIGFLATRKSVWDDLASASARVAVQLCSVVLITGMIWGRSAWGQWWTWSPRLTFSLVLWLLYVVYLMVRASVESSERRALISAVYGLIAFLDVPLVYLSVRLMPDIHPIHVELAAPMKATLGLWFLAVMSLSAGLIWTTFRLNLRDREERRAAAAAALSTPPERHVRLGIA